MKLALITPGKMATPWASLKRAGGIPLSGMAARASTTSQDSSTIVVSLFAATTGRGDNAASVRQASAERLICVFTNFSIFGWIEMARSARRGKFEGRSSLDGRAAGPYQLFWKGSSPPEGFEY